MFSLTICSFSLCSPAISSSTGATILHGPHHSAQKSTSTGLSLCSTSLANVASVTVLVLAPTGAPRRRVRSCSSRTGSYDDLCHRPTGRRAGQVRGVLLERGQPALGVERRSAAAAGRGDRLPVGVVDEVAGGEDAGDV